MRRVLYSGVAGHVEDVLGDGEAAKLLVIVDPDSGDHHEYLVNPTTAAEWAAKLAAPAPDPEPTRRPRPRSGPVS